MEFRWVAALTVWTVLSGPLFVRPTAPAPAPRGSAAVLYPLNQPPSPPKPPPARRS
jgi:hypothetical protein